MENFESVDLKNTIEADEKNIAAKLLGLRVQACLSCEDFAEALGVETSELEAYEDGSEEIPASIIAFVCALSGVPLEYFFGDEDYSDTTDVKSNLLELEEEEHALLLS